MGMHGSEGSILKFYWESWGPEVESWDLKCNPEVGEILGFGERLLEYDEESGSMKGIPGD